MSKLQELADELAKFGWKARVENGVLHLEEASALESPQARTDRLIWMGTTWKNVRGLALRINLFLRAGSCIPRKEAG